MSSRAIAPVVGASYDTVQRDIRADRNLSPATAPRTKTGLDGKTYAVQPRKPEPPHTVNTDTGEVIDKSTGEVITHLPDHDAAKVPNGPIVSAPTWAALFPDQHPRP